MIRPKPLIATAVIASVLLTACSDMTAPKKPVVGSLPAEAVLSSSVAANSEGRAKKRCGTEVTFTKWYTTSPAMTGFTCYGPGTYAGEILSRVDDGVFTQLKARYEVRDPRGRHSFTAVIQGTLTNATGRAQLTGVIIQGWRTGARVYVAFQRVTPCAFAVGPSVPNVCFQGIIHIRGHNGDDRDSDRDGTGDKGDND